MKTVWIRAQCDYEAVKKRYPELSNWNAPKVIIMPAFNELCGGVAFNRKKREFLGPIPRNYFDLILWKRICWMTRI